MLAPASLPEIRRRVHERTRGDRHLLDELREDVRTLHGSAERILARSAAAVSIVASDGGNSTLRFDPFSIQFVRVVDSLGKELCVEAISSTTNPEELSAAQLDNGNGSPTALGRLMLDLDIDPPCLSVLSPMIPSPARPVATGGRPSAGWAKAFRDLCEWAALYETICHTHFAGDTLVLRDGLLRTNLLADGLIGRLQSLLQNAIERHWREHRRRVLLAGLAKRSGVLDRYRLAMAIEGTLAPGEPRYVRIPPSLQARSYLRPEWATGSTSRFALGEMFFARFGSRSADPIWIVDVFSPQAESATEVFGFLLADAQDGFPVPLYPRSLQLAHENAQLVGFDLALLEDAVLDAIRGLVPEETPHLIDEVRLAPDFAAGRYA
jgi:hypothetical protein